jgi:uncharacterized protein (TIGR00369 family)
MEVEKDLIEKYNNSNRFGELLGMSYQIKSPGCVEYELTILPKHLATPIASHGGVVASLVDAALGVACLSLVFPEGKVVSTIEFAIKYLKPVFLGDVILAKAQVISKGKRILVSEVKVYNQANELVASASGTFNAYPKEKAGY